MNVIASIQGVAALRVSIEEVVPLSSPPFAAVISGIQNRFGFATAPSAAEITAGPVPLMFQAGKVLCEGKEVAISQLFLLPDGDIVVASTTDQAKCGLDSLVAYLNDQFGYRMEGKSAKRCYVSALVVEFEKPFTEVISSLATFQKIIEKEIQTPTKDRWELLRISFSQGTGGMPNPPFPNPLDGIEKTDFVIERRAGVPFSANRFFCTAPCEMERHIQILQEIERTLKSDHLKSQSGTRG
jgi:hypothetical protein